METTNLADLNDLPLLDWSGIEARLTAGLSQAPGAGGPDRHTCWLATINPDGSPHVTGVGALWANGCFWFETGKQTRKGRNLARDPRCTLSVAAREFDLVVAGDAAPVTDPATVARMAARCPRRARALRAQRARPPRARAADRAAAGGPGLPRPVARLVDAGVLAVVAERRVRGAVERTYVLRVTAASIGLDEVDAAVTRST